MGGYIGARRALSSKYNSPQLDDSVDETLRRKYSTLSMQHSSTEDGILKA